MEIRKSTTARILLQIAILTAVIVASVVSVRAVKLHQHGERALDQHRQSWLNDTGKFLLEHGGEVEPDAYENFSTLNDGIGLGSTIVSLFRRNPPYIPQPLLLPTTNLAKTWVQNAQTVSGTLHNPTSAKPQITTVNNLLQQAQQYWTFSVTPGVSQAIQDTLHLGPSTDTPHNFFYDHALYDFSHATDWQTVVAKQDKPYIAGSRGNTNQPATNVQYTLLVYTDMAAQKGPPVVIVTSFPSPIRPVIPRTAPPIWEFGAVLGPALLEAAAARGGPHNQPTGKIETPTSITFVNLEENIQTYLGSATALAAETKATTTNFFRVALFWPQLVPKFLTGATNRASQQLNQYDVQQYASSAELIVTDPRFTLTLASQFSKDIANFVGIYHSVLDCLGSGQPGTILTVQPFRDVSQIGAVTYRIGLPAGGTIPHSAAIPNANQLLASGGAAGSSQAGSSAQGAAQGSGAQPQQQAQAGSSAQGAAQGGGSLVIIPYTPRATTAGPSATPA